MGSPSYHWSETCKGGSGGVCENAEGEITRKKLRSGEEERVTQGRRIHLKIRSTLVETGSEEPMFLGIGRTAPSVWTAQAETEVEYEREQK